MATSDTTLAGLWVNDGTTSADESVSTPSSQAGNGSDIKDILQYYKDNKLDSHAKEVGLLDGNGELASITQNQNIHPKPTVQMIALPVSSPARSVQASTSGVVTPRIIKVATPHAASPVQVISAQNLVSMASVPQVRGTPQIISPLQIGSPSPRAWLVSAAKKRPAVDLMDLDYESKRKKGEKGSKGLRHFSMKVCEKVQKKGITSYNEVADELVAEFIDSRNSANDQAYEQKNIRRRVYDALNVLMAMNIISKEKKEIKWIGLPTNSAQECQNLELEKQRRMERIKLKTQQLQVLILQQIAFKNLVQRNRQLETLQGAPTANSAIQLPFIIVNTSKKTVIDCSISSDKCEYLFNFNNTFEIHDDIEVLKRMGLAYGLEKGQCTPADLAKAIKMVPKNLEPYVTMLAEGTNYVPMSTSSLPLTLGSSESQSSHLNPTLSSVAGPSSSHDHSLDLEVAMASGISRQSSIGSFSQESPEDGFSDGSDSERSLEMN